MSEPNERDQLDDTEPAEGGDKTGDAVSSGNDDAELSDLSETGVGLGVGEPNTFEPEEADPAADPPSR